MQKKEKKTDSAIVRKVFCRDCRNAVRDTGGRSFSIQTGEFFMGKCLRGRNRPYKVFMDKARVCGDYNKPYPITDNKLTKDQDENEENQQKIPGAGRKGEARQEDRQDLLLDA